MGAVIYGRQSNSGWKCEPADGVCSLDREQFCGYIPIQIFCWY